MQSNFFIPRTESAAEMLRAENNSTSKASECFMFSQKPGRSSQHVSFIRSPVDGQLTGVAGHVWVGSVLQKELDTVQVP